MSEKENTSNDQNIEKSKKDWLITFSLCWTLGLFGAHRFYNKKIGTGLLQLLTFGGFGIWALVDLINISRHKFLDKENNIVIARNHEKYRFVVSIFLAILIISNAYSIYTLKNSKTRIEKAKEKMDHYSVNLKALHELVFSKMVGMQVFMEYDATDEQIYELRENLNKINGVYNVTFVSKEEAYNIMKERLGKNEHALRRFTPDIFAVSFTIETSKKKEDKVYKQIQKLPYVREITSTGETSSNLENPITILSILVLDKYNEILIYSIIMLVTRTILSICILGSIYRNKEELTISINNT